jgi:hypothetical protein
LSRKKPHNLQSRYSHWKKIFAEYYHSKGKCMIHHWPVWCSPPRWIRFIVACPAHVDSRQLLFLNTLFQFQKFSSKGHSQHSEQRVDVWEIHWMNECLMILTYIHMLLSGRCQMLYLLHHSVKCLVISGKIYCICYLLIPKLIFIFKDTNSFIIIRFSTLDPQMQVTSTSQNWIGSSQL